MGNGQLAQSACLSSIQNLHYILMHTEDTQLQEECKKMIETLHKRMLLPDMELHCSLSKNSD